MLLDVNTENILTTETQLNDKVVEEDPESLKKRKKRLLHFRVGQFILMFVAYAVYHQTRTSLAYCVTPL